MDMGLLGDDLLACTVKDTQFTPAWFCVSLFSLESVSMHRFYKPFLHRKWHSVEQPPIVLVGCSVDAIDGYYPPLYC